MEFKKWSKPTKHSQFPSTSMPTLPQELITEILLRLPVKPLLRFRSVSKSWLALISSPQFVKAHLRLATSNDTHHMLALNISSTYPDNLSSFQDCTVSSLLYEPVTEVLDLDNPIKSNGFSEKLYNYPILGSVHGLICLETKDHNLFLWNPSTRKYKKLPHCSPTRCNRSPSIHGFGYDEFHDDYKVVVIFYGDDNSGQVEVKIYSLKSDSWKNVDGYPSARRSIIAGKFVNGKLHWASPDSSIKDDRNIDYINLADEKWGKVEQPRCGEGTIIVWPGVLGSDLSFYCSGGGFVDVWVMKEYGVKESWMKMFTIKDLVGCRFIKSAFMSNKGEILVYFGSSIFIYNSKDGLLRYSKVINFDRCRRAEFYVESLVCPFST